MAASTHAELLASCLAAAPSFCNPGNQGHWKSSGRLQRTPCLRMHGARRQARSHSGMSITCQATSAEDPLLLRAARGESVDRPPAWMMRQAGRYMQSYRTLAQKHPSFRERSEVTDLIVEISLQPWEAFRPDGVILFSDILTPLPAIGVPFEIDEARGPVLEAPIQSEEGLKRLHDIDFSKVSFVADSLRLLRSEVGAGAAVLGFIGAPWTVATYVVEGKSTRTYTCIKTMCISAPQLLRQILSHLAKQLAAYALFQVEAGAQCIQIFDSWGGQLPPEEWERWSKPYIQQVIDEIKAKRPEVPVVFYINGSGGLIERMATVGADVIGIDWTIDMADARARLPTGTAVQGNVDPAILFASPDAIEDAIHRVVAKAGPRGHILNLGHGVLVGTPEDGVAHFFNVNRSLSTSSARSTEPATSAAR